MGFFGKKTVTRIMKVTMDAGVSKQFDKGIIHSDKGLRDIHGKISALPDVEPLFDSSLAHGIAGKAVLTVAAVVAGKAISSALNSKEDAYGQNADSGAYDYNKYDLNDPNYFSDHPNSYNPNDNEHSNNNYSGSYIPREGSADNTNYSHNNYSGSYIPRSSSEYNTNSYNSSNYQSTESRNYDSTYNNGVNVSQEQADLLIEITRQKARELSAMIVLLSNITIKNNKTNEDYMLEQSYIRTLVTDENKKTMQFFIRNGNLLDDETVIRFKDFLSGYVCYNKELIPINLDP